jgi:fucose permease
MSLPTLADRRARWAFSAIFFVVGTALGGYVSHLPDIQNRLHLSHAELGRTILFSAVGAVTTMPLCGLLIHRFGSRGVCLFACLALLAAVPLLAVAPSVLLVCAALYLVGATNGQLDVAMNTHSMGVQDRFPRPILSAVHGWFSIGGFAGGAGTALAARLGLEPLTHLILASVLLVGIVGVAFANLLPADIDRDAEGPRLALPSGRVLFLGVLVIIAFVSEGAIWDWGAVYLRRSLGTSAELGAIGFGLASLAMAIGRFLGDAWTHRAGYLRVLWVSAVLTGGGVLLAVGFHSVPLAIAGFIVSGLGMANVVPVLFRAAAVLPGVSAGAGLAAITTCGYTGFLGGPAFVGFVADRVSLAFALGLIAAASFAIAALSRQAAGTLDAPSPAEGS